jgi:hypothetical protein
VWSLDGVRLGTVASYISQYMEKTVPLPVKDIIVFAVLPSAISRR